MHLLPPHIRSDKIYNRVLPFAAFLLLTGFQGQFGEAGRYWVYLAKTLLGAWLLYDMIGMVQEVEWNFSWEAWVVGIGVCVMWVGIDPLYPPFGEFMHKLGFMPAPTPREKPELPWNPFLQFGAGTGMAWFFVVVRTLGSAIVVPPLEEVFYRSFVYRYIIKTDFLSVSPRMWSKLAFFMTTGIFAFSHYQWLAAILCGFAYQGLVLWKGRYGDAIAAHAITNFLLAVWVVWQGAWQFW
jgi:uncharacterized protein